MDNTGMDFGTNISIIDRNFIEVVEFQIEGILIMLIKHKTYIDMQLLIPTINQAKLLNYSTNESRLKFTAWPKFIMFSLW